MIQVLCVDDRWQEEGLDVLFKKDLQKLGIQISFESEKNQAFSLIQNNPDIDLILLDLKLPDNPEQGKTLLTQIKKLRPDLPVIILSGLNDSSIAEECCVDLGAAFYFVKNEFNPVQLGISIRNAVRLVEKMKETERLNSRVADFERFEKMVGASKAIRKVLAQVEKICHSENTTVVLRGEKGVGKDLLAEMIHLNTEKRKNERFVRILCSAIPENIFEAELFGVIPNYPGFHCPDGLPGKFKEADRGTIFLNEIGDMPLPIQAKVIEVIERKSFRPLGKTDDVKVNVRIIAATNQNLEVQVKKGEFRGDLFDRLKVYSIYIPPLRERKEDIPALVDHFIELFNFEQNRSVKRIDDDALQMLCEQNWPGNVRELKNEVERSFVVSSIHDVQILTREHFTSFSNETTYTMSETESKLIQEFVESAYKGEVTLNEIPREYQSEVVKKVLEKEGGIGKKVAKILDISPGALRRKLSRWRISTVAIRKYEK